MTSLAVVYCSGSTGTNAYYIHRPLVAYRNFSWSISMGRLFSLLLVSSGLPDHALRMKCELYWQHDSQSFLNGECEGVDAVFRWICPVLLMRRQKGSWYYWFERLWAYCMEADSSTISFCICYLALSHLLPADIRTDLNMGCNSWSQKPKLPLTQDFYLALTLWRLTTHHHSRVTPQITRKNPLSNPIPWQIPIRQ